MVSEPRRQLSDDHQAVHEILKQLLTALGNKDVQTGCRKLDLLWARLAVHIRAEHLHLFPTMMTRLTESPAQDSTKARSIVETLYDDHNFFMRELAQALATLREIPNQIERPVNEAALDRVLEAVRAVATRLARHNEIEEHEIYVWATTMLTDSEQAQLATQINHELETRPPRFSPEAWLNECLLGDDHAHGGVRHSES